MAPYQQVSRVIWQKATSPCCHPSRRQTHVSAACAEQTHWPVAAGKQCTHTWVCYNGPAHPTVPLLWEDQDPHLIQTTLGPHESANKTTSWSAHLLPNTQTGHINRHTPCHATCDSCSNRPHLCTACRRCGLIKINKSSAVVEKRRHA